MRARSEIPSQPLIATTRFGRRLSPAAVARAIARGLAAGDVREADLCPLPDLPAAGAPGARRPAALDAALRELGFDARMRRARAVIVGQWRLQERTLAASAAFEIATRARQAGVPSFAVTGDDALSSFDARMLDLQVVLLARHTRELEAAGRRLAALI